MHIHEISYSFTPKHVHVGGADNMVARAKHHQTTHWVSLGEMTEGGWLDDRVTLFMHGPDAAEKADRLAAAINAALAPPVAINQAAE